MPLQLRLSDLPQVLRDGVAPWSLAPRDAALLAWLVLEGPTSRDRLGELLWPDSPPAQARTTLRQRLFKLRQALGEDVATGSPLLHLVDATVHDLADSPSLLGDLLLPDAPEFNAWLTGQREQRRARELESLREQAQALEDAGDPQAALRVALTLRRLEPQSEPAHQRLMRLHYLTGDRAAALAAFDTCEQMLKHELGTQPSPQTLALLATVESAPVASPPAVPRALPAAVLRPPHLVGRERELAALARTWDVAHVAAVIGEAGMGKSRLLTKFVEGREGVARAAARPGDAGVPFATLARLLRAVPVVQPAALDAELRRHLVRVLPELGLPAPMPADAQRLQLQRAVAGYLAVAPALRAVVLDDLHFADAASLDMLQGLFDEGQALRWLIAYRPAEAGSAVKALELGLQESARLEAIELAPLDEAAAAALVDQLGLGVEGGRIAPQLLRLTGGNPLYMLETLKQAWVERSLDRLEGGTQLPRAASVSQLIARRIDRLPPTALALARVAAVAGLDFSLALAEAVMDTPVVYLADAVRELESAQVIRGSQFAHDLVFEAVLRSVPQGVDVRLHQRTAGWLEAHGGEPARLARHWLAGHERARAVPWLKQAAHGAMQAFREREAAEFLLQAASIEEDLGDRSAAFGTVERLFADELMQQVPEPLALADRLDRLATDDRQRACAALQRGWLLAFEWRLDEAVQVQQRALALARQCGDASLIIQTRHALAMALAQMGRFADALPVFESIQAALDANPQLQAPQSFLANFAMALDQMGRVREAHTLWLQELEQKFEPPISTGTALSLSNLAVNRYVAGDVAASLDHALDRLRRYGAIEASPQLHVVPGITAARCERLLGAWRQAEARANAALAAAAGSPHRRLHAQAALAEIWVDLGQFQRALVALNAVLGDEQSLPKTTASAALALVRLRRWRNEDAGDAVNQALARLPADAAPELRLCLSLEQALSRSPHEAAQAAEAALAQAQRLGLEGLALMAQLALVLSQLEADPPRAAGAARRALELAQTRAHPGFFRPELWLVAARALGAAGDAEAASRSLQEGREWVQQRVREGDVPAPYVEGFLHRHPVVRSLLITQA